jgi:hypothetical protein
MKNKLLKTVGFIFICSAYAIPTYINCNQKIEESKKAEVIEVLSNIDLNTVDFNENNNLNNLSSTTMIFENNILEEKIADISQKYVDTEKYYYVNTNTVVKTMDSLESSDLCNIEYGSYIKCIGENLYNDNMFSKVVINEQVGYILTENLTNNILFRKIEKNVYAKTNIKAYTNYNMQNEYVDIKNISEIKVVGINNELNIYEIKINDLKYYINISDTSDEMLFVEKNQLMYNKNNCNIYDNPDTSSKVIQKKSAYKEINVIEVSENWAKVETSKNTYGYIELSQLTSNCPKALKAVNYAYKMLGTPYVWGGASTKGTDCSGLTLQCYRYAGITIPRTSREQNNIGTKVSYSEMKPGDLITWSGAGKGGRVSHVGIYVGDGYMIHAGNSGVCKASVAAYKRHTTLVSIIRVTNY